MTVTGNRKNIKRNLGVLALASAILALAAGGTRSAAQTADWGSALLPAPIEGTWIVKVDRIGQGVTFTALQSFATGGVALATGELDHINPISPLYGSWKRTAYNSYAVTIWFFAFDPSGNAVAMIKNNQTFRVVGRNHLIGAGDGFACDTDGQNCVNAGSIKITGERVIAEGVAE